MGELSAKMGLGTDAPKRAAARQNNGLMTTVFLLVIVGLASLVIAEQVVTGWLALGERANILRSNKNAIEILVIVGATLWGLLTLWTAFNFLRGTEFPTTVEYFTRRDVAMSPGVLLSVVLVGLIGVFSLLIAEQVLTGWIALADRVNIPRSNLNALEIITIIGSAIWGLVALRTVYGFWIRDRRVLAWAQWVVLFTAIIGMALFLSGMFDIHDVLPRNGTVADNLPGVQELTAPGLLIFLSCFAVYRFLTMEVDTPPATVIRNTLEKVPGAGAIIGFLVIFTIFALASDLFLEQRSLAGLMATNITRGIVAIGITFLMISGEFDLSVGSTYGVGALIFLLMMTEGLALSALMGVPAVIIGGAIAISGWMSGRSSRTGIGILIILAMFAAIIFFPGIFNEPIIASVIPAALIALFFTGLLGFINGGILVLTGIPSFIVTLGTLLMYRAILLVVVADGRILRYADYRLPPPNIWFNRWLLAALAIVGAVIIGLMAFSLIRSAWAGLRERLANYQTDTNDFRDFWLSAAFLRLIFVLVTGIGAVALLVSAALGQVSQSGGSLHEISFFNLANGRFDFVSTDVNLRIGVMWWFILVIVFQFVLTQTRYGNHVFAAGGNPGAARAQGINVNRVKITNFIICAMLACVAGIINVARLSNVDPLMGDGLELEVIAASVIGGALLSGGYGSIIGALLGVLIFGMLQTGLVLVGVDARSFSGIIGFIIIVAVVINTLVSRARK
jgi:ribose/xylose/arabinose/galactoside ABC-type transport system permease subunit